jgi:uncharacterized protein (DUF169 family)
MNLDAYHGVGNDLCRQLRLPTGPLAITYIKSEDEIPERVIRPSVVGQKWSLCQAFTYSRRWGWHCAMTEKDNFCVPASAMHRWVDVSAEDFVESQVRQGWHTGRKAEENRYAFSTKIFGGIDGQGLSGRMRDYIGFVCSPLTTTLLEPDTILIYGDGTHITHIIHALTFDYTYPVTSSFEGFGESCVKGGLIPFITGRPQVVIPGMGDRSFAGIHDHEIGIGFPASLLTTVTENLFKSGGHQNMGQPVKTLLPMGLNESITPGFTFLRSTLDEKKTGRK